MALPKPIALSPLLLLASACTVGPDYRPPVDTPPARWSETLPADATQSRAKLADWWRGFHDAKLNALIDRAMTGNLDLQAAQDRIQTARSQLSASAAGLWPRLNLNSGYQRARLSPNALKGILSGAFENGAVDSQLPALGPIGEPFSLFQLGFDSTWEVDVFGGVRRQMEAWQANAQGLEEQRRDMQITLTAEVARHYLGLIAAQNRLQVARHRLAVQQKIRELAEDAYQEGFATALDKQRAVTEYEATAATLPGLEASLADLRHSLAVLLGQPPAALDRELAELPQQIPPPPTLPAGTPAEILRRRPDIRAAERTVAQANALVGAAVADLFPKINLTGAVGLQSQNLGDFASLSSGFYGVGPRLSLPLFQAGRLLANLEAQKARNQETLKAYQKTVLNALREIEDALANLNGAYQQRQALLAAEQSARQSQATALDIYREGEAELQAVLDAQRVWFDVQEQLLQSELAWAGGHVALFKALGGGWDDGGGLSAHP